MNRICRLHGAGDLRVESAPIGALGRLQVQVKISTGGICGSDLHYYQHGGFGPIQVVEPLILGHEVSGTIAEVGDANSNFAVGDRVAINPNRNCGDCYHCRRDEQQHCLNIQFLGSARTRPHVQGAFRDTLVVDEQQCVKVAKQTLLAHAACTEPLAVCLHAAGQAGDLGGKRVLVTGSGPIGALCIAVAMMKNAAEAVATDITDYPLRISHQMGATSCINVSTNRDALDRYMSANKQFDVVFECSAAEPALLSAIELVRPRGTIVQVGVTGSIPLPINAIVGKEIVFRGTHRFHSEFADAAHLIDVRKVDVEPLITQTFALSDAELAFRQALDRSGSMKVHLSFNG